MSTRKPGMSRDAHTELGLELDAMSRRLGQIASQLGHAYSLKLGDEFMGVQSRLDRLRSKLDDIVFREYPKLSLHGNASLYYPGVDPLGPRRPRRPS